MKEEGTYDKNNRDDKYVMYFCKSFSCQYNWRKWSKRKLFAAKVFKVQVQQSGNLAHQCPLNLFKREVFTVSGFNHPVIIKYIGYNSYSLIEKLENSKDANTLMLTLIIEYKENGNLESAIATEKLKNDQTTKLKIITGIAIRIKAFNKSNVVHRDLKPDNIVLDKNNDPVIIDFGCSRQYYDMVDNNI